MNRLAWAAVVAGAATALLHVPCLLLPGRASVWLKRFPRGRTAGWILSAIDLAWAGWLLHHEPLGRFEEFKPLIFVLVPVVLILVCFLMDELLASRALGGLFLLAPAPLLDAARWHASPARLVVVAFSFALVAAGLVLVLSPYHFRRFAETVTATDARCRAWAACGLGIGLCLLLLGLAVY